MPQPRRIIYHSTRTVDLRYILQRDERTGKRNKVHKQDYFDTDLIEKTYNVKRLPRSYIIKSFALYEIPFDKTTTKIRRHTLPHQEYLSGFVYHVQDQVEFYEVITYSTEESFSEIYIQPPFLPILRVRAIDKIIRRPVYDRTPHCTELDVLLEHDPHFFKFWIDTHKRDVLKYQEGNGILLIKASPAQARLQYWNQQIVLSKQLKFLDNTASRIIEANFLSLLAFSGDTCAFYEHSTAKPLSSPDDNLDAVIQEFWHVRSDVNGLPETLVTHRGPKPYHICYSSYPRLDNDTYKLYGATVVRHKFLSWDSNYNATHRFKIANYQPGVNSHYDWAYSI